MLASSVEEASGLLFRPGRDADHAGLRVLDEEGEEPLSATEGGRVIRVQEFFSAVEPDTAEVYDRDVGESSEEE